jgi:3-hydroxyisobutyrate dehydrogenase
MAEAIGFVGLGQMGFEMASRLGGAGFALRVWNRTRAHSERLAAAIPNVSVCGSAREAANGVAIVVSSLADDRVVREVVLGDDGVAAGLAEGGIHVARSPIPSRASWSSYMRDAARCSWPLRSWDGQTPPAGASCGY